MVSALRLKGASPLSYIRACAVGCAPGTARAFARDMAVRDFKDLLCWQLANELKCEVVAFTATGPASRDFRFRDQIRDSAAAAARDIAEGFGRFRPREFARFLEYARASLMETQTSLVDGRDRAYIPPALYHRLNNLARAALKTTTNLMLQKQQQAEADTRARKRRAR
jgi:four helix bundle protein